MDNQQPNSLFELLDILDRKGIPKSEQWKFVAPFLKSKSRRLHIPVHGIFELTPLCNFDCKMCYVHLNHLPTPNSVLLPVKYWKSLSNSAKKSGLVSLALTGGECLTYPDFDELYIYLITSGIKVYIMSNGYYLDTKLDLFRRYTPSGIQISIYGSSEDAYETVTGVRAFTKVMDNIILMQKVGIHLSLSITPSIHMRNDIKDVIQLAESLNIKYGVNPQLTTPRDETGRKREDLSVDEYLDLYHFLSYIHHESLQKVDLKDVPSANLNGTQRYGIRCGAGRSTFGIKYDGSMCPCLSLDKIVAKPLEIGFEKAWEQINDAAEQYALPLECGDCIYQKHCLSCVAVHGSSPLPGHCDPNVCDRMKRLVLEGFIPLKSIC